MLHLHRADRADRLADALAGLLARPLGDPFDPELVAVPTRGMERWLAQRLSATLGASAGRRDGICAGVEFPPPRTLLGGALALASGIDPDRDPWLPERAVWPLLEVVEANAGEPWLAPLARAVGLAGDGEPAERRRGQRLTVISHVAALFHRYGRYRPEVLEAWAAGHDVDGAGGALPERLRWQAELWRALRECIGQPSPAERLGPALARLREEPEVVALPERLAGFGLTRLAAADRAVIGALAAAREVHLFLLHPSPALWASLAGTGGVPRRRAEDRSARQAHHPLLRSWGRDSRELQLALPATGEDHPHPLDRAAGTLLERLQADIVADRRPDGTMTLDPGDQSVTVHACHGRARQVEVLRDAVLAALQDDPGLEPRDVVVMCPDIEAFAPLIQATFGPAAESDDGDLRLRLADRSLRQTNGVLAVLARLLELAGGRLTASEVLDFADREPVRRRFRLRDDDLTLIGRWVRDTGIRWGLDRHHREPFRVDLDEGTWAAGLDRVLLGVTLAEAGSRRLGGALPLDGIDDIDLAGRLAELVARLRSAVDALSPAQTLPEWARSLEWAAGALTATSPADAWQATELRRLLDELLSGLEARDAAPVLTRTELRALLGERLAGRPTRANFRTGHLTVCTMYPMRSVPHRVVCLLGLDDGVFPRKPPGDGDDLLLAGPLIGERDPRSEDRQLLLDALLAAEERLIVTFAGADERTNLPRPPAVPVGELLDALDATARRADGAAARTQVLVRHPLQPFDRRNFEPGRLVPARSFSFDRTAYAGARARSGPRRDPPEFLAAPLPAAPGDVISLGDLADFIVAPAKAFLAGRLGVRLSEPRDEISDALPVELDPLEGWGVGQRLLDALLAGADEQEAYRAELARGLLPPGHLAVPVIRERLPVAAEIARVARAEAGDAARAPLEIHVPLADGRLLYGGLLAVRGEVLLQPTFSRVQARQRLTAWVRLVAATATDPARAWSAVTVGRGRGDRILVVRIPPLGADPAARARAAQTELARLIDLYDRGMREPLPLPCRTAAAYVEALRRGEDPREAADGEWRSSWGRDNWIDREDAAPEAVLVWGERAIDALLAEPPALGEAGEGWAESERCRFGRLARRLWDPLLEREVVS
jgi:exodeoxyribonuclease V gamma subunit